MTVADGYAAECREGLRDKRVGVSDELSELGLDSFRGKGQALNLIRSGEQ